MVVVVFGIVWIVDGWKMMFDEVLESQEMVRLIYLVMTVLEWSVSWPPFQV
jgi:hypothetical protein